MNSHLNVVIGVEEDDVVKIVKEQVKKFNPNTGEPYLVEQKSRSYFGKPPGEVDDLEDALAGTNLTYISGYDGDILAIGMEVGCVDGEGVIALTPQRLAEKFSEVEAEFAKLGYTGQLRILSCVSVH